MRLWIAIILICTGCQVTERPAVELPPLTLSPPPTIVYSGSCDDRGVLEDWLQTTGFQQRDFIDLMQGGVDKSPDDLYFDVEQMARLRDRIASEPVPDCAVEVRDAVIDTMNGVLIDYQAYVNEVDGIDLQTVVDQFDPQFETLSERQNTLMARLNAP